jgi:hypothetical protein
VKPTCALLALLALLAACAPAERPDRSGTTTATPAPSRTRTTVAVDDGRLLVNGTPTTLFGFRVASAAMRDDWTEQLIAQLDTWRDHGVNSFTVWLQGSSGGYARVFTRDGTAIDDAEQEVTSIVGFDDDADHTANGTSTGTAVVERTRRIIEAADARGMVVIVGLFYGSAVEDDTPETLAAAARTGAAALRDYSNVIFNVFNEPDLSEELTSQRSLEEYLAAVKEAAPGRLVGTGSVELDDTEEIAELDDVDVVLHDAGADGDEAIDAFEELTDHTGKPVVNVESFGGSGQGFVDEPPATPAREGHYVDFPGWRRIYGAWRTEDSASGSGGAVAGKDSYLRLIDYVGRHPDKRVHLMVHVAGWFQGASRVGTADHLGEPSTPNRWNNTFDVGPGAADGTSAHPGIRWILERIAAHTR